MSLDFYLITRCKDAKHKEVTLFETNATHNLKRIWEAAGCQDALYESEGKRAKNITPALLRAYFLLTNKLNTKLEETDYKTLEPSNGWGNLSGAINVLSKITEACLTYPNAIIRVSRLKGAIMYHLVNASGHTIIKAATIATLILTIEECNYSGEVVGVYRHHTYRVASAKEGNVEPYPIEDQTLIPCNSNR